MFRLIVLAAVLVDNGIVQAANPNKNRLRPAKRFLQPHGRCYNRLFLLLEGYRASGATERWKDYRSSLRPKAELLLMPRNQD
ncbi:hypothetical protein FOZ63_020762 [Perkinsus olseni]|uniref:Secreted protein n=1 Tax=Perkinsus olseni TaxID=32597 RepID=A0A7J6TMR9_PEROL|nr:hypothetical protein FOZ63_020762 [Perkinsus olseni]